MRPALAGALVFLISFAVHGTLAYKWDRLGVFEELDVLFDADASRMVYGFVHDGHLHNWRHPNLGALARPWLKAACGAAGVLRVFEVPADCPYYLVCFLAPLMAALTSACFFAALRACGLSVGQALLWTLLQIVSFSSLVFGSVPESYPFSGLAMAAAFWLAAQPQRPIHLLGWGALAVATTAITTSNLIPLLLLFVAVDRVRTGWWRVAARAAAVVLIALLGNGLLLWMSGPEDRGLAWGQAEERTRSYAARTLREYPATLVATVVAPPVRWVENDASLGGGRFVRRVEQHPPSWPMALAYAVVVGLIVGLAWLPIEERAEIRALRGGAAAMLVFHLALHCVFRKHDLLLYSQHWQVPLLFLVLPLRNLDRRRWLAAVLLVAVIGAYNTHQVRRIHDELRAIAAAPPRS